MALPDVEVYLPLPQSKEDRDGSAEGLCVCASPAGSCC